MYFDEIKMDDSLGCPIKKNDICCDRHMSMLIENTFNRVFENVSGKNPTLQKPLLSLKSNKCLISRNMSHHKPGFINKF